MIALCVVLVFVVGTVLAIALVRGAHYADPPFDPILRCQPKERDRA